MKKYKQRKDLNRAKRRGILLTESEFCDGRYVGKKEVQNGIANFVSDHEVNALRREQRKCEEGAKVTSMTENRMRIKNLVGKDYKFYDKNNICNLIQQKNSHYQISENRNKALNRGGLEKLGSGPS